jgi:hypothetical protein
MIRAEGDYANWVLVVILVALALLLAMVSSTGYGSPTLPDRVAGNQLVQESTLKPPGAPGRSRVQTDSDRWYVARELYRAGEFAEAREMFDSVVAAYPNDPAVRMWAGLTAARMQDWSTASNQWSALSGRGEVGPNCNVWFTIARAAAELELGRPDRAAHLIVPLERGDFGQELSDHPIVCFYAAVVYEKLALVAPTYLDAVGETVGERLSPPIASTDQEILVSPNSRSWLVFLAKRSLVHAVRQAGSFDRSASLVSEQVTAEPSFAPTAADLLDALGSSDFAAQARLKLRALDLYLNPPSRRHEPFNDPDILKRWRFIA